MRVDVSQPANIWQRNPHLHSFPKAKRFFQTYGEDWFNKVYYAIYLVYDPLSPLRKPHNHTDLTSLRKTVKRDYFQGEDYKKFNWSSCNQLGKEYASNIISREKRELEKLFKKLLEAQKVVDAAKITDVGEIKAIGNAIEIMYDLWERYYALDKIAKEQESQGTVKGFGGQKQNLLQRQASG